MNASRYVRGDFLGGHNDVHEGRIIGAVLYLNTTPYSDGSGGRFFMKEPGSSPVLSDPNHNAMMVVPFKPTIFHGVTPIRSDDFVRNALGVHFMKDAGIEPFRVSS